MKSEALWSVRAHHYQRLSLSLFPPGRLRLSSTELAFIPGPFAKPWRCSLADIVRVEDAPHPAGPVVGSLVSCFRIVLKDGSEEIFSVRDVDAAIEKLTNAIPRND